MIKFKNYGLDVKSNLVLSLVETMSICQYTNSKMSSLLGISCSLVSRAVSSLREQGLLTSTIDTDFNLRTLKLTNKVKTLKTK